MCNCVLCRCGYLHWQFCEHQEINCVHKSYTYFNTSIQHSRGERKNGILSVKHWLWTKFWLPWVEATVQKSILKQQRKTSWPINHLEWVLCKPLIICMAQGLFPPNNHVIAQHLMEPKMYSMYYNWILRQHNDTSFITVWPTFSHQRNSDSYHPCTTTALLLVV